MQVSMQNTSSINFSALYSKAEGVQQKANKASDVSAKNILKYAEGIIEEFEDGFQLSDILNVVRKAVKIADEFEKFEGAEKKKLVTSIVNTVIEETDGPGPDWLIDPILEFIFPILIDKIVEELRN